MDLAFLKPRTAPRQSMRTKDVINPSSVMLSGAMMFEFLGWKEVATLIEDGIARHDSAEGASRTTLSGLMPGATKVGTSAFASSIIENMQGAGVPRQLEKIS